MPFKTALNRNSNIVIQFPTNRNPTYDQAIPVYPVRRCLETRSRPLGHFTSAIPPLLQSGISHQIFKSRARAGISRDESQITLSDAAENARIASSSPLRTTRCFPIPVASAGSKCERGTSRLQAAGRTGCWQQSLQAG